MDKKWYSYVDIYDVVPDERNSKDHDIGVLCESMIRSGFTTHWDLINLLILL